MALHEAIQRALLQLARPLTAGEIRTFVQGHDLYVQKAGTPVTVNQVCARIRRYPQLCSIDASNRPFLYDLVNRPPVGM